MTTRKKTTVKKSKPRTKPKPKSKTKAGGSQQSKRPSKRVSQEMLDLRGQMEAINRSQAVIEFDLDGTILTANENFLTAMGYSLGEVQGRHHRMFVEESYAESAEYRDFWADLRAGNFRADEFKRVGKGGREVWIQATYNPIFDKSGNPSKVIKYATDVTETKRRAADQEAQIDAIHKSQAVIEFNLDGTIISANENFLATMGYTLREIKTQHHRMFVTQETAESAEYREFWNRLNRGEFVAGEFQRIGKGGKDVWIQATYNPIFDLNGRPVKVVKFATDITATKELERQVRDSEEHMRVEADEQQRKANELLAIANSVAQGDLSGTMPDLGDDALGQVAMGIGTAIQSIRGTLTQVRIVADEVAANSQSLATASESIASGAQQQASSLEETAASLEEITSAVKQNTDNSIQAQQVSSSSREVADAGGSVVGEAVEAMNAISISTGKATDIITTIDEIAFQTNLLALNAAVEAARAGEQGRGFAVVASEVRNLAQRSAGAAKEIKQLLQNSFSAVETGSDLVHKSGETFQDIVTSVKRVADIVAEISSASTEQLAGIEQVNNAVSQMDQVTQANASQTQQMSITSHSLQAQSEYLLQLVGEFNLGTDIAQRKVAIPTGTKPIAAKPSAANTTEDVRQKSTALPPLDLDSIGTNSEGSFVEF